jgi:Large polyvalent protein associated domain 29
MDRNFFAERIVQRALELQAKHQGDPHTYQVELVKLLVSNARNENERKEWVDMLKTHKKLQHLSQNMERREIVDQVRELLKTRHPFVRFHLARVVRSTRRWNVRWSNGPLEAEIKDLIAPFERADLTFDYHRRTYDRTPSKP